MAEKNVTAVKDDFIISGAYTGYTYLGQAFGKFKTQDGEEREYFTLYVASPVSDYESDDYHASGWKAEKKSCISRAILDQGFMPGNRIKLFFDDRKRVVMIALDE